MGHRVYRSSSVQVDALQCPRNRNTVFINHDEKQQDLSASFGVLHGWQREQRDDRAGVRYSQLQPTPAMAIVVDAEQATALSTM
jgi:hypothetical protein